MTADEVNNENENSLSCHMLFFAELHGSKGNGHAPRDPKVRQTYNKAIIRILKREYKLTDSDFARLTRRYMDVDGPHSVRKDLLGRRPDQRSRAMAPSPQMANVL